MNSWRSKSQQRRKKSALVAVFSLLLIFFLKKEGNIFAAKTPHLQRLYKAIRKLLFDFSVYRLNPYSISTLTKNLKKLLLFFFQKKKSIFFFQLLVRANKKQKEEDGNISYPQATTTKRINPFLALNWIAYR